MNKPIIVEKFADNGEHSHWSLVNCETGELLWSEAPEEEMQKVKTCNKPAVSITLPVDRDKLRICIMDAMIEADYQDEQWHDEDTVNLAVQKLLGESPIQYAK